MKCLYYLTSTLDSTQKISDDLHSAGVNDWFIHVISKDEVGLNKKQIHSSNYLETLDLIRDGLIGAVAGFCLGTLIAVLAYSFNWFGTNVNIIAYAAVIVVLTGFGAWEGGLAGVASENKKIRQFHNELEKGKYLVLIYAKRKQEDAVKKTMAEKHPEASFTAVDSHFYNPFTNLKRV